MHGIYVPNEGVTIPFKMRGMMSYLPTRLPTEEELRTCRHIQMTSFEEWRPYSVSWGENEAPYEGKDHEFDPERHQVNESIGFDYRNVEMVTSYREIGGVRIGT